MVMTFRSLRFECRNAHLMLFEDALSLRSVVPWKRRQSLVKFLCDFEKTGFVRGAAEGGVIELELGRHIIERHEVALSRCGFR